MKHLSRILALLVATTLIVGTTVCTGAVSLDRASVGAQRDMAIVAADYDVVGSSLEPQEPLPSSYSSADLGLVTPVRSQVYNTCWAYAASASLESLMIKNGSEPTVLSPMHMNYWSTIREDGTGWNRNFRDAGYPYIALGYLTSWNGARLETDFPEQTPFYDYETLSAASSPYAGVTSVMYLDGSDRDTIKTAVMEYGGVTANFHFNGGYFNPTTSSYYDNEPDLLTSQLSGHAVEIIGWDDNYSRENFGSGEEEEYRPVNNGAWLCKNSWGAGWSSLGGYVWISYEDYYIFEQRFGPSYAITGYEMLSDDIALKQVEEYGAISFFNYIKSNRLNKLTYANVLDFSDEYRVLDKVIFECEAEGADYEVYLIPLDDSGKPDSSAAAWTLLASGAIGYQGYHCIDVEDTIIRDDRCAIGVTVIKTPACSDIGIGVDEWLQIGGSMILNPGSRDNVSYILGYDTEATDVMDLYREYLDDDLGGNFVIKATARSFGEVGDVDLDGRITIFDVTKIQRALAELIVLTKHQQTLADYDADGIMSIHDATRIQRMLAGLIDG